jgi:exonuclease VII small subunit
LSAACQHLLEAAELRVQQLVVDADGVTLQTWDGQSS